MRLIPIFKKKSSISNGAAVVFFGGRDTSLANLEICCRNDVVGDKRRAFCYFQTTANMGLCVVIGWDTPNNCIHISYNPWLPANALREERKTKVCLELTNPKDL